MVPIDCPETSMLNESTLRNNPEDGRIQVNRSGSLGSQVDSLQFFWGWTEGNKTDWLGACLIQTARGPSTSAFTELEEFS
jgi:hypothetical protein